MKKKKIKQVVQAYRYDDDFIECVAEVYLAMNADRYYTFDNFLQMEDYKIKVTCSCMRKDYCKCLEEV